MLPHSLRAGDASAPALAAAIMSRAAPRSKIAIRDDSSHACYAAAGEPSMIDIFALLLTTAQVGVAFAGFGALASGLSTHSGDDRVDAGRLINMMSGSLSAAILSLAPCALALFETPEPWIWRTSAMLGLGSMLLLVPAAVKRTARMARFGSLHRVALVANYALLAACALALTLCAFGIPADHLAAIFFAGLFALLISCSILFFRVIYSMLRSVRPD
jgi:hypothetical protein